MIKYTKDNPLRVFEAFAGYGSQTLALEKLHEVYPDFCFTAVGISEIEPAAIKAYDALHTGVVNYGDISKIDWSQVPDFDLFTMSSPCQDFSQAGLQKGGEEGSGTRSSLLWECRRAILAKKPKYIMLENVAALVSKKFIGCFNKWQGELASYGYRNFAQLMNAKHYGTPQNRNRIFLISIRDDGDNPQYHFPSPFPLEHKLQDVLEDVVDTKYYLNPAKVQEFVSKNLVKIREYAEKGVAEGMKIEKLPEGLRKWVEEYEDKGQGGSKVPTIGGKVAK